MNEAHPVVTSLASEMAPILLLVLALIILESGHQLIRFFCLRHIDKVGFSDPQLQAMADSHREFGMRPTQFAMVRALGFGGLAYLGIKACGSEVWAWLLAWAASF